jgi:subtilisin-like proprotein convertase family protein
MKMTKLKVSAAVVAASLLGTVAQGQLTTTTTSTSVNALIPDGNPVGMSSSTNLTGIAGTISSVTVNLDITGGFNGDLYAYLAGPAGEFTVLLNRVGVGGGNSFGYGDTGFNITFSDGAPDIHDYQSGSYSLNGNGQLIGTWNPDARNINPQSSPTAFDSASPTADLSSFNSQSANGTWTLFVADMSSGGQGTWVSWGLSVVTVPEPQTWAMVASGVGMLLVLNRRRKA